jgi:hypothetical protein
VPSEPLDEVRDVGMFWGEHEKMLNALDSLHGNALVILQRKLVNEVLNESSSLRGLLYVGSKDSDN